MAFLFFEIWVFLVIAFFLGMFVQYWFCCRGKEANPVEAETVSTAVEKSETSEANHEVETETETKSEVDITTSSLGSGAQIDESWKPMAFAQAPTDLDDLKRIKGIGAVIEKTLNELGIYQFKQIAEWTDDNVTWVEGFLAFPGRVNREDWVNQAQTLATGGKTEFSNRVDGGDIDYS